MENVLTTLFHLVTKIKWISDTSIAAIQNKDLLDNIIYADGHYKQNPYSKSVSCICQNLLIIHSCSFMDEFDKQLTPSKHPDYADRIIKVKKNLKPAICRIRKWDGLKNNRNHLIAHGYRVNGISIFELKEQIKYVIPTTNAEYRLLADLLFLIAQTISKHFPELIQKMDFNKTLLDNIAFESEKIDCSEEFDKIKNKIGVNINNTIIL